MKIKSYNPANNELLGEIEQTDVNEIKLLTCLFLVLFFSNVSFKFLTFCAIRFFESVLFLNKEFCICLLLVIN